MKAVILAGGQGARLSEETTVRPKPMVEIGGRPILWHIMKIYSAHGINDFVICCGYKGYLIKQYFASYLLNESDITLDLGANRMTVHSPRTEDWRVTLVDTGAATMTGGRLRRVRDYLGQDTFCLTYGDGVADIDLGELIAFHRARGALATLTIVQPPGRFGVVSLPEGEDRVGRFQEKPGEVEAWVNGGFFVLEPRVIDRIAGDDTVWEQEPMRSLAHEGQLTAFRHRGFWQPMDTLRDRNYLEDLWRSGSAPWKIW